MNILWTLTGPWKGHRWQQMFKDLSTHKEVSHVYVIERSYDLLTFPIRGWKRNLPSPLPTVKSINPKLTVVRYPLLYPEKLLNPNILVKWLKPIVSTIKPDVAIVVSPFHIPWAISSKLSGAKVFYFVYDEIRYTEDGKPRHDTLTFENKLSQYIDGIIATAWVLAENRKGYGKPVYIRPNGTDTKLWSTPREEPDYIKDIPHPRIVFHGHMGPWIDHELFVDLIKNHSSLQFIVVGKLSGEALMLKELTLPNLHIIPFKPQEEVAAIVQHCDIAFMPFRTDNDFSKSINPLKLYEALSAGIPVVISNLPTITKGPGVYIYERKEDVHNLFDYILKHYPNKEEIQAFANKWDWHNINKTLLSIIGGKSHA